MTRPVKILLAIVAVVAIVIQFVRPDRTSPPVDPSHSIEAVLNVPRDVKDTLVRSCYDCHSHQTRWPWYSRVAPVSWLIANDVTEGREALNFSTWRGYPPDRASRKLDEIADMVTRREMPMPIYTYVHRDATLSDAQIKQLVEWARTAGQSIGR